MGPVPELEAGDDVLDDVLDRPFRVGKLVCDLGSVVTVCDEPQDLDLPVGEPRDPETARLQDLALKVPDLLEEPAQQVGWQGTGSCGGMHDGRGNLLGGCLAPPQQS